MANDTFCELLGYARSELIGIDSRALTPADELPARLAERAEIIAGKSRTSASERRLIRKDGTLLWVHRSLSLVRDPAGRPAYFVSVIKDISARKQDEEVRAYLAAIVDNSNDAIVSRSPDRKVLSWNRAAERLFGYSAAEVMGRNMEFLIPPDREDEARHNRELIDKGRPVANQETVRLAKDGHRIDVSLSQSRINDERGAMAGVAMIFRDITASKQAEETRAYLAAIVDSSNEAIVSRGLDRKILTWNRAAERLFGYTANEAIGQSVSLLIPPDREEESARSRALLARGHAVIDLETVRVTKDGRIIDVALSQSPINDECGVMIGVAVIFRDISERKRKAALMQLLESLARATNEATTPELAMQACVALIGAYGNWTLGRVALYAPGHSSGIPPVSFWRGEDLAHFEEFIRHSEEHSHNLPNGKFVGVAMRERRPVWLEDLALIQSTGRMRIALRFGIRAGFVFPVFVDDEIAGFLEFFATATRAPDTLLLDAIDSVASQLARLIERSRATAKLAELNAELETRVTDRTAELEAANRELSAFTYTVAHDLRAPLRAINGFSSMVLQANENKLDEVSVEQLRRVHAGSERMGRLIDDLLSLSRLSRQPVRRQDFDLSALAQDIIAELAEHDPARKVAVTVAPGMIANGDSGLMRILLENLIGNAWKFTAKTAAPTIDVGYERRDGETVYYVRDNGAGFAMEYAHKLFAPFQRLHRAGEFEGTGIGLATARSIIQRHGGKIWADSAVNAGTTIYFCLGK